MESIIRSSYSQFLGMLKLRCIHELLSMRSDANTEIEEHSTHGGESGRWFLLLTAPLCHLPVFLERPTAVTVTHDLQGFLLISQMGCEVSCDTKVLIGRASKQYVRTGLSCTDYRTFKSI